MREFDMRIKRNKDKWRLLQIVILFIGGTLGLSACITQSVKPPQTVNTVDLQRYAGSWYEIAKIPNRFQRHCVGHTTASYSLRNDGNIDVTNRCMQANGEYDEAQGIARIVDSQSNAKLEVSFVNLLGKQLFWGDYWIIGLEDHYEYAIVGHPQRKYGWILSRHPQMNTKQLDHLFLILQSQGYDPDAFVITRWTNSP